jgi:hypothetical protein
MKPLIFVSGFIVVVVLYLVLRYSDVTKPFRPQIARAKISEEERDRQFANNTGDFYATERYCPMDLAH